MKPFADVDFPRQYPADDVAEHEVLMSFNDDDDAVAFHEWWRSEGAVAFAEYLARQSAKEAG